MKNKFDNLQFTNDIMKKTNASLKNLQSLEESKKFGGFAKSLLPKNNSSYKELLVETKLVNDLQFFNYLGNKYLGENTDAYAAFLTVITESIDLFNKLHMEVDTQPRFLSPALNFNKALSENAKIDIYKTHLEESIQKNFSQPLFEGTLLTKYEKESKLILESVVNSEMDLSTDNIKELTKYALFENTIYKSFSEIFIPDYTKKEIDSYISKQPSEYFTMFTENAQFLKDSLDAKINELTILIAPELFNSVNGLQTLAESSLCVGSTKEITPDDIGIGTDQEAEVSGEVSQASCVGPIENGEIVDDQSTADQMDVTVTPDFDITDPGFGSVDDAIGKTILTDPLELEGVNNNSASLDPDMEIDPIDLETEFNTSTNDPINTEAPAVEIDAPYKPADQLPEDTSVDIDSIVDTLEQDRIDEHMKQIATEPEEYIGVPVDQSYTEESTTFSYRQFAGARNIISLF